MAKGSKGKGSNTGKSKGSNRNKDTSKELKSFAYNMGRVQKGLSKDTQVKDSYNAGFNKSVEKTKKPLY